MPAWGRSMDDQAIWSLVAFLQRLPQLTPEAYQAAVEQSEGHSHPEPGDGHQHEHTVGPHPEG